MSRFVPAVAGARAVARAFAIAATAAVAACSGNPPPAPAPAPTTNDGWHAFEGTWTAAGTRQVLRMGRDRRASIASYDGTLLLAGRDRPGVGVRAEAIVLNDSATGMTGRAVWTDEHGDEAWSELRGEDGADAGRIVGTFVGGTGRYAGASGSYAFSWRFMLENEDGVVQGQSVGLAGRVRANVEGAAGSERK